MRVLRAVWKRIRAVVSRIPPTDRCLILFMAVLLTQSAYSLFSPAEDGGQSSPVDVLVRTASAAIFGYFLSVREKPSEDSPREPRCLHQATITAIGLFCLVTLLALRNLSLWDPAEAGSDSATATVAQFRDFVSGCVGFLIGSPPVRDGPAR